jgi:hypothetical protein
LLFDQIVQLVSGKTRRGHWACGRISGETPKTSFLIVSTAGGPHKTAQRLTALQRTRGGWLRVKMARFAPDIRLIVLKSMLSHFPLAARFQGVKLGY